MVYYSSSMRPIIFALSAFFIGFVFMLLQLPSWLDWLQSQFVVLMLLYFVLVMPVYVNVGVACFVGFLLDILHSVPIGENALALIVVTYVCIKFREQILEPGFLKAFPVILGLLIFYRLLLFLMQFYFNGYFDAWSILSYPLGGAIVWPFLAFLLFSVQRRYLI